jgi:hypothetical protein
VREREREREKEREREREREVKSLKIIKIKKEIFEKIILI